MHSCHSLSYPPQKFYRYRWKREALLLFITAFSLPPSSPSAPQMDVTDHRGSREEERTKEALISTFLLQRHSPSSHSSHPRRLDHKLTRQVAWEGRGKQQTHLPHPLTAIAAAAIDPTRLFHGYSRMWEGGREGGHGPHIVLVPPCEQIPRMHTIRPTKPQGRLYSPSFHPSLPSSLSCLPNLEIGRYLVRYHKRNFEFVGKCLHLFGHGKDHLGSLQRVAFG